MHINHREKPKEMMAATVLHLREEDPFKIKGWNKESLSAYYKTAMATFRQSKARENQA